MKIEPDDKPRKKGEKEEALLSRLEAVDARDDLDHRAKARARTAIKHETLLEALQGALPFQDGSVRIVAAELWPRGGVALTVELMDGSWRPLGDNPWVIVNPPLLVADVAGDVDVVRGGVVETHRVDALESLKAAVRRRFGA